MGGVGFFERSACFCVCGFPSCVWVWVMYVSVLGSGIASLMMWALTCLGVELEYGLFKQPSSKVAKQASDRMDKKLSG